MTLQRSNLSIPQVTTAALTYAEIALFGPILNLYLSFFMEISLESKSVGLNIFLFIYSFKRDQSIYGILKKNFYTHTPSREKISYIFMQSNFS